ncbi:MAG: hypothetical protein ACRD4X_18770 [Candidatus Acidiferrales bacterium]
MKDMRIPVVRNQALAGLILFIAAIWLGLEAGQKIIAGDLRTLELAALGVAACGAAVTILRNWRLGFYVFFTWMFVEDLVRKYLGNGTILFFGKDILLALVYIALYAQIRRGKEKWFRAPFLLFLSLFFWLALIEVFNQYSPSILYGLLGLKLYFYYVPLIYVGYALIRTDEDLRKFLRLNVIAAIVISGLGITQAIRGNSFLNPAHLAPALEDLGNLQKVSPISGEVFSLPDSVFVSSGRFDVYLIVAFIVAVGWVGYALLYTRRRPIFGFIAIGTIGAATLLCGNRGAVIFVSASALALSAGFLWGAPWRWGHGRRLFKAIRTSVVVCALGLAAVMLFFPEKAGSRIAFYTETLTPSSSAYALSTRTWDYPVRQFLDAFQGHWIVGSGTGTASLGTQYVSRLLGQAPPGVWVEEGFGALIAEMGILAPLLWLLWGGALLYFSWRGVRRLRGTRFFPLALAVVWYAFLVIFPMTYGALSAYQDFICNIYLWLMIGVLFRLPEIISNPLAAAPVLARRVGAFAHFRRAIHVP